MSPNRKKMSKFVFVEKIRRKIRISRLKKIVLKYLSSPDFTSKKGQS